VIGVFSEIIAGVGGSFHGLYTAFMIIAYCALGNAVLWYFVWLNRRTRVYEAASQFLGVEVSARNFPPSGVYDMP
jgi:hypothetical protein